ncbi:MAG: hypothetical protein N2556_08980, partial [Anaerolineae bacterium]|nr:hypothetical protein [Anaerolineae bacterium]
MGVGGRRRPEAAAPQPLFLCPPGRGMRRESHRMLWLWILLGILLLAAILYWQLVIAEGSYLGPRVVALLYDWA